MKKSALITVIIAMITMISSCSPDSDTEKPTVQILTPENESEFEPGDNISISFVLNDNDALKSFKIDLHENDGHNHGPRIGNKSNAQEFTYELIENIDGNPKTFSKTILVTIPVDAELVEYDLGVFAIDAAGNEQEKFINFHVD